MDVLARQLDEKLRKGKPEVANEVRQRVAELTSLPAHGVLDLMRSRAVEQEVLELLDESSTR
jgi:hypothetical protein